MAPRNEIQQEFDAFGANAGMLKKSGNWYHASDETISVLNLQKSQYGLSYYFNVGIWITPLGEERFPKEHKCHVRLRLGDLVPQRTEEISALLDLEHDASSRVERLRDVFERELKPFLASGESLDGLRQLQREGRLAGAFVLGPAMALLRRGLS